MEDMDLFSRLNLSSHMGSRREMKSSSETKNAARINRERAKLARERAQKIFLGMIENAVSSKDFVDKARYIDPAKYEDVVVERAINGLCGYPLCSKTFEDLFGERKYIIRNRRIYDISFRRNFCSNVCFEASDIVCKQLSTDPLYLRDSKAADIKDVEIPVTERLRGRYGELVDITGGYMNPEEGIPQERVTVELLHTLSKDKLKKMLRKSKDSKFDMNKDTKEETERTLEADEAHYDDEEEREHDDDSTKESLSKEEDNKEESKDPHTSVLIVERALREWMSFDSLRVVLGDKYVIGMLEHIGKTWDDYATASELRLDLEAKAKYIALCRSLDQQERQETADSLQADAEREPKRPLPTYEKLEEDAKGKGLKGVSLHEASDHDQCEDKKAVASVAIEEESSGSHRLLEGGNAQKKDRNKEPQEGNVEMEERELTLPFVDNYSQVAWRRHIVQEKLCKSLSQVVRATELNEREVFRLVKELLVTFDLSSHNISFKPQQWQLIAVILLRMLIVRWPVVEQALKEERARSLQNAILSGFRLDSGYLDRVLSYLTEIKHVLGKNLRD